MPRISGTKRVPRKWEVFPGRNSFYCNGRIVMAQRAGLFYLCVFIIVITSILFFVFDCPYLYDKVSPAVPVVAAVLFISALSNLFKTSFSDPGILPRATKDEAADIEKQVEMQTVVGNGTAYRPPPRTKEVVINSHTVKLKYCFTCKIFRPPRASHCSICDNCVDRFDHHCPWVGNCVGLRNYRYFYLFLVSLALQCVFFFTCALSHLVLISREVGKNRNFLDAIRETPSSVVVCIICFLSVWSVLGLAGFHTYLVTSNLTTNEDIKGSYSNKRTHGNYNPFHAGNGFLNCHVVLCAPLPPTLIDPRGFATDDFMSQRIASYNSQQLTSTTAAAAGQKNGDIVMHNFQNTATSSPGSAGGAQVSYNTSTVVANEFSNQAVVSSNHGSRRASHSSFTGSPEQVQTSEVVQVGLPDGTSSAVGRMRVATTLPEISSAQQQQKPTSSSPEKRLKKKTSTMPSSQSEHALSLRNIGLHNEHQAVQDGRQKRSNKILDRPMDLDQTTMIGSALDLDSLSDAENDAPVLHDVDVDEESRVSAGAGSQVGLLKLSSTAA